MPPPPTFAATALDRGGLGQVKDGYMAICQGVVRAAVTVLAALTAAVGCASNPESGSIPSAEETTPKVAPIEASPETPTPVTTDRPARNSLENLSAVDYCQQSGMWARTGFEAARTGDLDATVRAFVQILAVHQPVWVNESAPNPGLQAATDEFVELHMSFANGSASFPPDYVNPIGQVCHEMGLSYG